MGDSWMADMLPQVTHFVVFLFQSLVLDVVLWVICLNNKRATNNEFQQNSLPQKKSAFECFRFD